MIAAFRAQRMARIAASTRSASRAGRRRSAFPRWRRKAGRARASRRRPGLRCGQGSPPRPVTTPTRDAAASSLRRWRGRRGSGRACSGCPDRLQQDARSAPFKRRRVALQDGLELEPLAHRHDGDPVIADRPRDQDAVTRPGVVDRERRPSGTRPIPEVVMKTPSPLPRSTTLVSPVTSATPASSHAARIEATIRFRSASARPSSRMNAAERNSGRAPPTARSFTVPWTASRPMSPPGKKSGRTTNESVVKAIRGACHVAVPSECQCRLVLERAERPRRRTPGRRAVGSGRRSTAAAAVAQQDVVVPRLRQRAGAADRGRSSIESTVIGRRRPPG